MICVFINMTGTPEGSTESGFMEKPGIEPATPGLLLNNSFVVSYDVNSHLIACNANECLYSPCDVTDMQEPIGRHLAPDNTRALTETYDVYTVRNNVPAESMCTE